MNQPTPPYWKAWQRRIAAVLFPYYPAPVPEPVPTVATIAIVPVLCNISLADRIRLLLTGRCEVLVKSVVTQGIPGPTTTSFAVLPPEDWDCDPPPQKYPAVIVLPGHHSAHTIAPSA